MAERASCVHPSCCLFSVSLTGESTRGSCSGWQSVLFQAGGICWKLLGPILLQETRMSFLRSYRSSSSIHTMLLIPVYFQFLLLCESCVACARRGGGIYTFFCRNLSPIDWHFNMNLTSPHTVMQTAWLLISWPSRTWERQKLPNHWTTWPSTRRNTRTQRLLLQLSRKQPQKTGELAKILLCLPVPESWFLLCHWLWLFYHWCVVSAAHWVHLECTGVHYTAGSAELFLSCTACNFQSPTGSAKSSVN